MRINHNIAALNTYRQLSNNTGMGSKSLEKLSSGLRINRAADDAAGLAISEKMRGQIRGLDQANRNAQDSISLIQTAEGALSTTHNILQRMRELAVQASNDTSTDADRSQLQKEVAQLKSEVDRIASTTEFNTKKLLNGNLSGVKSAQGTVATSAVVDAADTAATSGTSTAGLAVSISNASSGQSGTGFKYAAAAELAEKTIIQTGVNDAFKITINGATYDATIAASSTQGYTRSELVNALNASVKAAVDTADPQDWGNEFNQAIFSLTSDNHLAVTTAATGSHSSIAVSVGNPTTAAQSSLQAMGFSAKTDAITGTVDLSGNTTLDAVAANSDLAVTLGNSGAITVNIVSDGGLTAGGTYTFSQLKKGLQDALDAKMGVGAITVGDDGSGHLKLTSNVGTGTLTVANGAAGTFAADLGIVASAGTIAQSNNTQTKGTNTLNANDAGTYISKGANDQFSLSVDGGATESITLTAGNYATRKDFVNEINNRINSNANLVGKVTASLATDGSNKIVFTSNSTGSSSNVTVSNPTATNQSALGALGYAGAAGDINVGAAFVDIDGGLDLTTAADRKMDVTLGNRTVTIDLGNQDIINTDTATATKTSSRDAIVKALQAELDEAFGDGALTVNTVTTATTDKLTITNNTRGAIFNIGNGAAGNGATKLFGVGAGATGVQAATVSTDGVNVQDSGTAAINNTISDDTSLSQLADADGNNLGLTSGNVINITGTQDGQGFATSVTVGAGSKVSDVLNALRGLDAFKGATVALDTATGKIQVTGADGETKDISNLTFAAQKSATDTTGIANFNRTFGSFTVTQQAQNASSDKSLTMQIGANQAQTLKVDINDMGVNTLKLQDVDVSTASSAQTAISVINNALETVSTERAKLGAFQNRLEHTISNLGTSSENLTASESRIRDVDMAKEMMEFTKNNILSQAAQAMLAQANQQPQGVLQLLR